MNENTSKNIKLKLKRRLPLLIFLLLCTIIFFFGSTLLLNDSYKDIILVLMIWSLPLFIH